VTNEEPSLINLGKTDLLISRLGLGTWQWGDRMMWGYGKTHTETDVHEAFQASLEAGTRFFDTAEIYGNGRSEQLLGEFIKNVEQPIVIATKFMPFPWRLWKGRLHAALRASLNRLGLERVDLYQIHWPMPPVSIETWANALADAVEAGLVKAVGVSNFNAAQMLKAHATLLKRGVPLASNQVEYHMLNRKVEKNGLLKLCHELEVTLIAYSPLAKGILTGKYTSELPPAGMRERLFSRAQLAALQPLIKQLGEYGMAHGEKSPAQVALNWLVCKGAVPIPGAKNARQAHENAAALGWQLSEEETAALDETCDTLKLDS
jgi:aryl-alcohol dehydrogenase-like predicted oxidoreductase